MKIKEEFIIEHTKVMTYFVIVADYFPIEYVTEMLGILPTSYYIKGDEIFRPNNPNVMSTRKLHRKETSCRIGTDYIETFDADEQVKEVIAPLIKKTNELLMIKEKYDCEFILRQVPIIKNGRCPALGYDNEVIDFCSKIGASIEIDLYAHPYEE